MGYCELAIEATVDNAVAGVELLGRRKETSYGSFSNSWQNY